MQFTSTPRGARLARRLVSHRLDEWGCPYDSTVNETLTLIAAELTSNAVQHGHVPGRDFHVRLTADADSTLRIEVADTRIERPTAGNTGPAARRSGIGPRPLPRLPACRPLGRHTASRSTGEARMGRGPRHHGDHTHSGNISLIG